MGEIIEFTTRPNLKNLFYSVNSNAINFEVKGPDGAGVELSSKIEVSEPEIIVSIGQNILITIGPELKTIHSELIVPSLLNPVEYRRLWISWHNGMLHVGKDNQSNPIMSCTTSANLKYVTFSSLGGSPLQWRIDLPPVILEPPTLKPIENGGLHWVPCSSQMPLPDNALIGGFEKGHNLYVIRAPHRGTVTPGKYMPHTRLGYVGFFWEMHPKETFEVLCGIDCIWVKTSGPKIPVGAVVGGHDESQYQESLYIARVEHEGHKIIGKVHPSHNCSYIPIGGKEVQFHNYEILVAPTTVKSANQYLIAHNPHRLPCIMPHANVARENSRRNRRH